MLQRQLRRVFLPFNNKVRDGKLLCKEKGRNKAMRVFLVSSLSAQKFQSPQLVLRTTSIVSSLSRRH